MSLFMETVYLMKIHGKLIARTCDLGLSWRLEGRDSALMMPSRSRSVDFQAKLVACAMIDDKRVGGGNPNAEILRGSHRSVVGECVA